MEIANFHTWKHFASVQESAWRNFTYFSVIAHSPPRISATCDGVDMMGAYNPVFRGASPGFQAGVCLVGAKTNLNLKVVSACLKHDERTECWESNAISRHLRFIPVDKNV